MAYLKKDLINVSKLYYYENKTQQEIAHGLGRSRVAVTRMLRAAQLRGIVQIHIDDGEEDSSVERRFKARFGLKKAVLVKDDSRPGDNALLLEAARYIEQTIQDGDIIGLGWGAAVAGVVDHMTGKKKKNAVVVPVIGGVNETEHIYNLNELAQTTAKKMQCRHHLLYAPIIVTQKETRDAIMSDSTVASVCGYWSKLDVLVVGIGALKSKMPEALREYLIKNPMDFEQLGVSGEICYNMFDQQGNNIITSMDNSLIRISYNDIKETPLTIAVAWGDAKVLAIISALNSGAVDVLVTYEKTALRMLAL